MLKREHLYQKVKKHKTTHKLWQNFKNLKTSNRAHIKR